LKLKNEPVLESRRKWLLSTGRGVAFSLIALGTGGLWKRNGISMYRETCIDQQNKTGCRQCALLDRCGHPKALTLKRVVLPLKKRDEDGSPERTY
jgi:hypothetical protein